MRPMVEPSSKDDLQMKNSLVFRGSEASWATLSDGEITSVYQQEQHPKADSNIQLTGSPKYLTTKSNRQCQMFCSQGKV